MYGKYTEAARRSLFYSNYEASCSQSGQIEAIHLLRGLFRQDKKLFENVLPAGTTAEDLKKTMDEVPPKWKGPHSSGIEYPFALELKGILVRAAEISENSKFVYTGHLLLAILLAGPECRTVAALVQHGVTEESVRKQITQYGD